MSTIIPMKIGHFNSFFYKTLHNSTTFYKVVIFNPLEIKDLTFLQKINAIVDPKKKKDFFMKSKIKKLMWFFQKSAIVGNISVIV